MELEPKGTLEFYFDELRISPIMAIAPDATVAAATIHGNAAIKRAGRTGVRMLSRFCSSSWGVERKKNKIPRRFLTHEVTHND